MDTKNVIFIPAKEKPSSRPAHPQAPLGSQEAPLRVALYCYASERRTVIGSPQSMEARLRDFVESRPNWKVVAVYCDIKNETKRDNLDQMISDAAFGRFDLIVTQHISQLGKDGSTTVTLIRRLASLPKPVGVYFVSEQLYSLNKETAHLLSLIGDIQ